MSFQIRNFSVLAYGTHGFTLWHYSSSDSVEDMLLQEYFLPANDMLQKGDQIYISTPDDAAIFWVEAEGVNGEGPKIRLIARLV